jgi:hypothetical protein
MELQHFSPYLIGHLFTAIERHQLKAFLQQAEEVFDGISTTSVGDVEE